MKPMGHPIKIRGFFLLIVLTGITVIIHQDLVYSQENKDKKTGPIPKVISFNPDSAQYQSLFDGDKDSVVFYSGVVTLTPNHSGEIHNTEKYEEMIIPLEGEGQLRLTKHKSLDIKFGKIGLVPPHTEHQMVNTGTKNFKYIYIATKSK